MNQLTRQVPGAFMETLMRSNSRIREDRALEIAEGAKVHYRRTVEDLSLRLNQLQRERRGMLDLSPHHADSLVLAADFKPDAFVAKDIDLGIQIRETEIRLEIATASYTNLFGPLPVTSEPVVDTALQAE